MSKPALFGPDFRIPDPPRPLGEAGASLWNRVQTVYVIDDPGGVELLVQACAAADRAEEMAAIIARDGPLLHTSRGVKDNPALRHELLNRAFVTRTLQRLGLNLEPVRTVTGRPPASPYFKG